MVIISLNDILLTFSMHDKPLFLARLIENVKSFTIIFLVVLLALL